MRLGRIELSVAIGFVCIFAGAALVAQDAAKTSRTTSLDNNGETNEDGSYPHTKWPEPTAFYDAQGWGKLTPGGRGGRVIPVTTLADHGPGSFREALMATAPRYIVFDVAGTITLESKIAPRLAQANCTIYGQTARGEGVHISASPEMDEALLEITESKNWAIQHLRISPGASSTPNDRKSGLALLSTTDACIDRCTFRWAHDKLAWQYNECQRVSWTRVLFSEGLSHSSQHDGRKFLEHSKAFIAGKNKPNQFHYGMTMWRCLFVHNYNRNPQISGIDGCDVINCIAYIDGRRGPQLYIREGDGSMNFIKNLIKSPNNRPIETYGDMNLGMYDNGESPGMIYLKGNIGPERPNNSLPEWAGAKHPGGMDGDYAAGEPLSGTEPWLARERIDWGDARSKVPEVDALSLESVVYPDVGATRPVRDADDARVIDDARQAISVGIIDCVEKDDQNYPGSNPASNDCARRTPNGHPDYTSGPSRLDLTQVDCVPSSWKVARGLDADADTTKTDSNNDGVPDFEDFMIHVGQN